MRWTRRFRTSRLKLLPLRAAFEHGAADGLGVVFELRPTQTRDAIDGAIDWIETNQWSRPADAIAGRNLAALMLFIGERYEEAYRQMQLIGENAREFPWTYFGEPMPEFLAFRAGIVHDFARTLAGDPPCETIPGGFPGS